MISKHLSSSLLAAASLVLFVGCPPGPIAGTDTDTDTDTDSSTSDTSTSTTTSTTLTTTTLTTSTSTTGTETDSDTDTDTDPTTTTTGPAPVCGDGTVDDGEECDDGNTEDGDGCTAECKDNVCGDGIVNDGVEICDDGVNDGGYGGCMADCSALGPGCGDGVLQMEEGEACDPKDPDAPLGCLSTCQQAKSCLEIISDDETAPSGVYKITPAGYEGLLDVQCEMVADGGGYTFLKLSPGVNKTAAAASAICANYGMDLLIPRTPDHLAAAITVALEENVPPLEGAVSTGDSYLSIFGIYPGVPGDSCVGSPLNSDDCAEWIAADGGVYFVSDEGIEGEPSTNNCEGCSLDYIWMDGQLLGYQATKFGGGKSGQFFCDVGDK
ncbi:MAG TPA: hypothetical protein ENJ18_16830 [Nannocystis exedens]|nr:hypothetical protein [Nannocystis exedens]